MWLSELSRLLPELKERYPDLPSPTSGGGETAKGALFEAITRLVEALSISRELHERAETRGSLALGAGLVESGDYKEAHEICRRGTDLARGAGEPRQIVGGAHVPACVRAAERRGDNTVRSTQRTGPAIGGTGPPRATNVPYPADCCSLPSRRSGRPRSMVIHGRPRSAQPS